MFLLARTTASKLFCSVRDVFFLIRPITRMLVDRLSAAFLLGDRRVTELDREAGELPADRLMLSACLSCAGERGFRAARSSPPPVGVELRMAGHSLRLDRPS